MRYFAKSFVSVAASIAVAATPALATKPNQLQSLVGAKGSSGEMELERQGFVSIDGRQSDGGVYTYWWNARDKNCISVFTSDGRYQTIKDAQNSAGRIHRTTAAVAAMRPRFHWTEYRAAIRSGRSTR